MNDYDKMSLLRLILFFTEYDMKEILAQGFAELGIGFDEKAAERFEKYFEYLEEKNKVMNLTAISGKEDVARLHFLDSAALLKYADLGGSSVIDVGTGAGFPGLALKIAQPEMELTLLDSLNKRIDFLKETCELLDLNDVTCIHARAEEAPEGYRESFDAAVSRAVSYLPQLCELCLPLVKVGGVFIAMKGPDCEGEVNEAKPAIGKLGGKLRRVETYTVPGTDIRHSAVIIEKLHPTPKKYPRKWGQIKKQPL